MNQVLNKSGNFLIADKGKLTNKLDDWEYEDKNRYDRMQVSRHEKSITYLT